MKKAGVLVSLVILVPIVMGQFTPDFDRFTDYDIGTDPTGAGFYTWYDNGCASVQNHIVPGYGKSVEYTCGAKRDLLIQVPAEQVEVFSFTVVFETNSMTNKYMTWRLDGAEGELAVIYFIPGTWSMTPTLVSATCSGLVYGSAIQGVAIGGGYYRFTIKATVTLDWDAGTITAFNATKALQRSSAGITQVALGRECAGSGAFAQTYYLDNLIWDGTEGSDLAPDESLFGDEGPIWGGNKTEFAETLLITEPILELLYALLFIMIGGIVGYGAFKEAGAVAGVIAGLAFDLAFGLIPVWVIFFLLVFSAAAFFLRRRNNG